MSTNANNTSRTKYSKLQRWFFDINSSVTSHPVLYLIATVSVFLMGYFAEKALNTWIWPNPAAAKVEALETEIDSKTSNIEKTLQSMESSLDNIENNGAAANQLRKSAEQLRNQFEKLRPDLAALSSEAKRINDRLLVAKENSLSESGLSKLADFRIRRHGGATICEEGVTVGYDGTNYQGDADIRISYGGDNKQRYLQPGEALSLTVADRTVSVSLVGFEDDDKIARMNFDCDAPAKS